MSQYLAPAIRLEPAELQRQMRAQDKDRYTSPDVRDIHPSWRDILSKIWVVYVWRVGPTALCNRAHSLLYPAETCPHCETWVLAGFVRRRNRRKPRTGNQKFASIRRKLNIDKTETVRIVSLLDDWLHAKRGDPPYPPPQHFGPRLVASQPANPKVEGRWHLTTRFKDKPRKVKDTATKWSDETKFLVFGRWFKARDYTYLGPLEATNRRSAFTEANRKFAFYDLIIVPWKDVSPKYKRRIKKYHIVAGQTKIHPNTVTGDVYIDTRTLGVANAKATT